MEDVVSIEIFCAAGSHRRQGEDGAVRRSVVVKLWQLDGRWRAYEPRSARQKAELANRPRPTTPASGLREKLARKLPRGDKPEPLQIVERSSTRRRAEDGEWECIPGRSRWDLRCEMCGLTVPARDERLQPLLDNLATAGVSEISLAAIGRMLRKQ